MLVDRIEFLKEMSVATRHAVAPHFHKKIFKAGELILQDATSSNEVYFVLSGRLRIGQFSTNGQEIVYGFCETGGLFGELAAIDNLPRSADVHAVEDCEVACISAANFRSILASHPEICLRLMQRLGAIIRRQNQRLIRRTSQSSYARIYSYLADRFYDNNKGFEIAAQSVLAAMLDVSRETVARALAILKKEEIIHIEKHVVTILKIEELEQMIEK